MSPLLISWLLAAAPAVVQADSLKFPLGLATGPDRALYVSEREGRNEAPSPTPWSIRRILPPST